VRFLMTFIAKGDASQAHDEHHAHETGFWAACIWWPAAFLLLWQFVGGVAPSLLGGIIAPIETHALYFEHLPGVMYAIGHPSLPLAMTIVASVLGLALGLSGLLRSVVRDPHDRVFPLGRLAAEIRAGDRYEDVQAKMVLYQQAFGAHRPVELSEEVDGLELRDVSVFEPLELRVRFDAEGRVSETHFSAD